MGSLATDGPFLGHRRPLRSGYVTLPCRTRLRGTATSHSRAAPGSAAQTAARDHTRAPSPRTAARTTPWAQSPQTAPRTTRGPPPGRHPGLTPQQRPRTIPGPAATDGARDHTRCPSSIDDTAELPKREPWRGHSPRWQFGRDSYERLIVRESLRLELTMAPAHVLLRRLGEVPKHLRNHPRRLPRAQRAGTSQVVHEFLVHLSCARHPCSMTHLFDETQESCPKSGKG